MGNLRNLVPRMILFWLRILINVLFKNDTRTQGVPKKRVLLNETVFALLVFRYEA